MGFSIDTTSSVSSAASGRGAFSDPPAGNAARKTSSGSGDELSEEERRQVEKMKQRDREVRAHEMAHVAAGGQYVRGGASFEYQAGPDGGRYAVGGEVSIDTSPVRGDPKATVRKMQAVQKAALAPAQPSGQDLAVAAKAAQAAAEAQRQATAEEGSEAGEKSPQSTSAAQDAQLRASAGYDETGLHANGSPSARIDLFA